MSITLSPQEPRHRADPVFGRVTMHQPARRRMRWTLAVLAVLAAVAASVAVVRFVTADSRRDYLGTDGWPATGQGAWAIGDATPHVSASQQPAAIASMAKVMTAYLVLRVAPLQAGEQGPTLTITQHDVDDTDGRRARDESLVRVAVGERITERQALMAVLLPSANNLAVVVTRLVDPTVPAFVRRMNATARALGMRHTVYTDPSGFDDGTVSTAADQLLLARAAGADRTLAAMVATPRYVVPVQGTIRNTDVLLGSDGFLGMKTGSDDAAGGCFMFHARRVLDGRTVDVWGVVMGQPGRNLTLTGQYAARQLVRQVTP